jgi:peptidoglycan hydrolase-like protein with peptidoglycan-binding domain
VAKPGVLAFRALLLATYRRGTDGGITRPCSDGGLSEHKEGRAWDWMLDVHEPRDAAVANAVLVWLLSPGPHGEPGWNARRLGIMYIIWDAKIWGAYRPADGWRPYTGSSEHTDHIHFSFSWAGAEKRTSWWTGTVAAVDYGPCQPAVGVLAPAYRGPNLRPCPALAPPPVGPPVPYAKAGDTGSHVRVVQIKLGVRPPSGFFGARTLAAVLAFQKRLGLRQTGVVEGWTAYRLGVGPNPSPPAQTVTPPVLAPYAKAGDVGSHVRVVQIKLGVRPASGFFGARTLAAVLAFQKRLGLRQTGVVDGWTAYRLGVGPNPSPPPPAAKPVPYAKIGDRGVHVRTVQIKLGVRPADGIFGPRTLAAVQTFQKRLGLTQTGVVDGWTAYRLGVGPNPSLPAPVAAAASYARPGERSARVRLVQTKLGVRPATGFYGTRTVAAVKVFQKRWRLPQTGVVDHATAFRMGLVRA